MKPTTYQQKFKQIGEELKNLQTMIDKEVIPLYERALDESVKQLMKTQKERNEWKEKYEKLKNETDKRTKRKINK